MPESKCSICRRAGDKLFLRGDRCLSPKCALLRRNSPPGPKGKRRFAAVSEYGKELKEKQMLKFWYGLREKQFSKYVKKALARRKLVNNIDLYLSSLLEKRLDNVVFRLGFGVSRKQARKMVSHNHFLVNGKRCNLPSYEVKKGDVISVKPLSLKKTAFQNILISIKKYQQPGWLELNKEKLEGKVLRDPTEEEINIPVEIPIILEFYSR